MASKIEDLKSEDPRTRHRDLRPTPGQDDERTSERQRRKGKPVNESTARVAPHQGRSEAREQPPDLQDIERDIVGGTERARYEIERE